jgi:hypothetical protein
MEGVQTVSRTASFAGSGTNTGMDLKIINKMKGSK